MNGAVVYLIDDDVSYLRAAARLFRVSGYTVVIHNSAAEFLAELKPGAAGCVVTDLQMPGMDGIALQAALHDAGSLLAIIFVTGHGDIPTSVQAMRHGAEDFLTKDAPRADLLAAVQRALARNAQAIADQARRQAAQQRFELLSDREQEVLRHVLAGELNKQIAGLLGIHERTVKLHRTGITTKLQVHSVAELARLAQEAGWFDRSPAAPCPTP